MMQIIKFFIQISSAYTPLALTLRLRSGLKAGLPDVVCQVRKAWIGVGGSKGLPKKFLLFIYLPCSAFIIDDYAYLHEPQKFCMRWSGFVRNDVFLNSRRSESIALNTVTLVPLEPNFDPIGNDINGQGAFVMSPLQSFIRLDAWGIECAGYQLHAAYQVDFLGIDDPSTSTVRLWNAFMELMRCTDRFILGLYRHPLYLLRTYPRSFGYNVAATPVANQLRWWHTFGASDLQIMFALYSEQIFTSYGQLRTGEIVSDAEFIRDSGKPGFAMRLQKANNLYMVGAGFEVFQLMPRIITSTGFATEQHITAVNATAYASWDDPDYWLKLQLFWGQNLSATEIVGGYALSRCATITNDCSYANIPAFVLWFDTEWRRSCLLFPGFFVGWAKTFDSHAPIFIDVITQQPTFFGFNSRLHETLRVAPRITAELGPVRFGLEYEYMRAVWGPMNRRGTTDNPTPVGMWRWMFVSWCDF